MKYKRKGEIVMYEIPNAEFVEIQTEDIMNTSNETSDNEDFNDGEE